MFLASFQTTASSSVGAEYYSADCSIIVYFAPTELLIVLADCNYKHLAPTEP